MKRTERAQERREKRLAFWAVCSILAMVAGVLIGIWWGPGVGLTAAGCVGMNFVLKEW